MPNLKTKKVLSKGQQEELLKTLKTRFEKNLPSGQAGMNHHKGIALPHYI